MKYRKIVLQNLSEYIKIKQKQNEESVQKELRDSKIKQFKLLCDIISKEVKISQDTVVSVIKNFYKYRNDFFDVDESLLFNKSITMN